MAVLTQAAKVAVNLAVDQEWQDAGLCMVYGGGQCDCQADEELDGVAICERHARMAEYRAAELGRLAMPGRD